MSVEKNNKVKVGIVGHKEMDSDFVVYSLLGDSRFFPISVPRSSQQVQFIKDNQLDSLIIITRSFSEKNYRPFHYLSKLVNDIPIVVVSESVDRVVQLNSGFMGKIGHADYNEGLGHIPNILQDMLSNAYPITRGHLRHPTDAPTKMLVSGVNPAKATILDLSLGGAQIKAPRAALENGRHLTLAIPRGKKREPLLVNAETVRVEPWGDTRAGQAFERVGLKFNSLFSYQRRRLLRSKRAG